MVPGRCLSGVLGMSEGGRAGAGRLPFHAVVSRARSVSGLSVDVVAERWGRPVQAWLDVESGERPVMADEVHDVADALGLSVRDLMSHGD